MEKIVELSRRMQAAADMVSSGNRVCDVGCDHGYVSIYLVQSGKSPSALAMDVNQGPLLRAKEHVRRYGVEPYITLPSFYPPRPHRWSPYSTASTEGTHPSVLHLPQSRWNL